MATAPISDTVTRNDYTATAGQTEFAYTFWIKDEDHLDVYVNDVLQTLGGGADYTVSAAQSVTGANVVFNSGLNLNDEVAIVYNPDVERQSEFTQSGQFAASSLNLEFSYIVSILQYLKTLLSRTLRLSDSDGSGVSLELPPATANTVMGWNSAGTAIQNYTFANVSSDINTNFTSLTNGDFLQYNSTSGLWENTAAPAATVADDSITLAKMAHGTDGNLISFNASGEPAYVATGTSGQVLTSNGAGAAPTFQTAATAPVTSVAGKTGAVTLTSSDVSLGNVANVDQQNASNLTSGTVGTARLGTGTADSTTFLRGDGTWNTPTSSIPTTFGATETYVLARRSTGTVISGSTISGGSLQPASFDDSGNISYSGTLSGTWRNMGEDVGATYKTSLWVRIS